MENNQENSDEVLTKTSSQESMPKEEQNKDAKEKIKM